MSVITNVRARLVKRKARLTAAKRKDAALHKTIKADRGLVEHSRDRLKHLHGVSNIPRGTTWLPGVERVPGRDDVGPFVAAGAKICWHTMEGSSVAGGIAAFRTTGSWPHISFDPLTGDIAQHIPLNRGARALEHHAVETNRANVIQVELAIYSDAALAARNGHSDRAVANLKPLHYERIAALARKLEAANGVPRRVVPGCIFKTGCKRLSSSVWLNGAGHTGHEHVPDNIHWDPDGLLIGKVLG